MCCPPGGKASKTRAVARKRRRRQPQNLPRAHQSSNAVIAHCTARVFPDSGPTCILSFGLSMIRVCESRCPKCGSSIREERSHYRCESCGIVEARCEGILANAIDD